MSGSTSNAYKMRFRNHTSDMLRSKKLYELTHFKKFPHAVKDISFTVIEQIENTTGDLDRILLTRESYWAAQLCTLSHLGLTNVMNFVQRNELTISANEMPDKFNSILTILLF